MGRRGMEWPRAAARVCVAVFLAGVVPGGARAAEPVRWSVQEAIGYAFRNSPDVAVARSKVAEKEEAAKEVFANYLPDLTLEAGYQYQDNVPRIEFAAEVPSPVPGVPPVDLAGVQEIGAKNNYLAKVNLNQLLFASGRVYYAHRAAQRQAASARMEVEAVKLAVARQTAEAYLSVLISRAVAEVQRQALATAEAHLEQVRNRYEAGAAGRLELLRAHVEVSNVEPRVIEAEQRIEAALVMLRRATGLPEGVPVELTDSLEAVVEPVDEEQELERAKALRPEFEALEYGRSAAEDRALSERGRMLPRMQLTGSLGYERPYFSIDEWERVFTVGVGLQVPLFDGLEAYRSMRRARAAAETVSLAAVRTHADVRTQVHTAVLALREAAVRIEATAHNRERAEEMLEIAQNSYVAGAATNVEVIDAQLAATRARLEHLKALHDYRSAQIRLAAATGALASPER